MCDAAREVGRSGSIERGSRSSPSAAIVSATDAAIAQIGAGLAWRTNRESVASVGLLSNRLLLVGIAVEVSMIALLAYTPGLDRLFHTSSLGPWHWLFLLIWPPAVLGAEEARKTALSARASRISVRADPDPPRPSEAR